MSAAAAVRSEPGSGRAGREELLWPAIAGPPRGSVSAQTVPPPPKASVPIVPNWWKEPQPPPERRAQWAEWVGAVRALLASELALHGLAYLGVLLTFIGAFGFVVFAYGELDRSLRPVAEAVVPLVCFLTAWFLRRQQAPHVAAGLEFLGGLLLPLVAYASLVDDVTVPPDLVGPPLVAALALVSLALSGAYAAWSAKHPGSPLRYLVAPMAWQVVWALGLAFAGEPVAGVAIRTPNQWQMAAYVIAVVASIALANAFPTRRLALETRIAALVGLALGYALMLATGFADGWEAAPVALTGLATVVGIDLLAAGVPERAAAGARLAQSVVVAFTVAALVPDLELGWAGVAATIAAIALLERWARRRSTTLERAFALAEMGVGLAMATTEPWTAVAAFGAASGWAHLRRIVGFPAFRVPARAARTEVERVDAEITWMDAAAALLPVGVAYGLWQELGPETALVVSAALLAAAALAYLLVGIDRVASFWLVVSAACLGVLTFGPWEHGGASGGLVLSAGLCSAVVAVAAPSAVTRIWLGAAGIAWTAFLGMELAGLTLEQRALVWAGAGLLVVLVAAAGARSDVRLHFIAAGQLASAGALGSVVSSAGGYGWPASAPGPSDGWSRSRRARCAAGRRTRSADRSPCSGRSSSCSRCRSSSWTRRGSQTCSRVGPACPACSSRCSPSWRPSRSIDRAETAAGRAGGRRGVRDEPRVDRRIRRPTVAGDRCMRRVDRRRDRDPRVAPHPRDGVGRLARHRPRSRCSLRSGRVSRMTGSSRRDSRGRPWCSSAGSRWTTGSQGAGSAAT